jgi:hypothetical protein
VKNILNQIRGLTDKQSLETQVDEELRFHIDMQTIDYQQRGLSHDESRAKAKVRFGDVERIKKECIRIGSGKTVLIWILNSVFMFCLTMGLLLRAFVPEMHVNRVGDVMMMIGGLGILLVYAKQAGARVLNSNSDTIALGLKNNIPPTAFDERGRTPFERVRADD